MSEVDVAAAEDAPPGLGRVRAVAGRWVRRPLLPAAVALWFVLGIVWIRAYRWSRYAEIDEAAYLGMAARLADGTWTTRWSVLRHEGVHGPLLAMLSAPVMVLTATDLRVLIAVNLALVGVTALATASLVRRLAGPGAGVLAGIVVLGGVGVVEMGRTAMTAVLPMCCAALALVALERSEGLTRWRWCAAAGVAAGAMTLGRSMSVGYLPMLAVAGAGWAIARRSPWRLLVGGGSTAAATALAVAGWWWWLRWDAVSDYLFGGGSADTVQTSDRLAKTWEQVLELLRATGPAIVPLVVTAVVSVGLLLVRALSHHPRTSVVEWPLVAALAAGFAALSLSSAPGIGFTFPMVPALVTVVVAAVRRAAGPSGLGWPAAAAVTTAIAVAGVATLPGEGLALPTVWSCDTADPTIKVECAIDSNEDGEAWRAVNDHIADRVVAITASVPTEEVEPGRPPVAMTPRDVGVNPNTVGLSMQIRHRHGSELWAYFTPGLDHDRQIDDVLDSARAIVVVDEPPAAAILGTYAVPADRLLEEARRAGYRTCDTVPMPDGRRVRIVVDDRVPDSLCEPS